MQPSVPRQSKQKSDYFLSHGLCGRAARRGELSDVHRRAVERVERELFAQALALAEGNLTRAAAWLGITRLTLREKLTAFGLRPER